MSEQLPGPDRRSSGSPSPSPSSRSRLLSVLAVLLGAGLVLAVSGRTWATVALDGVPGRSVVGADGGLASPGSAALALVAAAGAVAMATAGRWSRRLVAGLLVLAGIGVGALAVAVLVSPADAVRPAVAAATGTVGAAAGHPSATAWPVVSAVGGLLVVVGGAAGLLLGGGWPGPSRRYEATGVDTVGRPADAWDRLSVGEDPTDGTGRPGTG